MDKPSPTGSDDASSTSADASTGAATGAATPALLAIGRWFACARWANRQMLAACDTIDTERARFLVSNHATYHRCRVMQMVRQFGGTVKSTDYLYWLSEAG